MAKPSMATRAPRGTKNLAKAFFAAADEIPEPQRAEVVKAALALIRDELKAAREKVALAKAKAKKTGSRKPAGVVKALAKRQKRSASVQSKVAAERVRKAASKSAELTTPDEPARTADPSNS
jgi:hypothetical protein